MKRARSKTQQTGFQFSDPVAHTPAVPDVVAATETTSVSVAPQTSELIGPEGKPVTSLPRRPENGADAIQSKTVGRAGSEERPAIYVPTLAELLRPSIGAPLIKRSDGSHEPKFGAPHKIASDAATIEGTGEHTRILYTKLAAKDGDWRAWHRLWPHVKPSPAMMDLFVRLRAQVLANAS